MLTRIAFVVEILAIVVCLYRIYGKKIEMNWCMILFVCFSLFLEETLTVLGINQWNTIIFTGILFLFTKWYMKASWKQAALSVALVSILITVCQFLAVVFTVFFIRENEVLRALCVNLEVLCFGLFLLPKLKLDVLRKRIRFRNTYVLLIGGVMGGTVLFLLMQAKVFQKIRVDRFILLIPAVILLGIVFIKWNHSQKTVEQLEQEKDNGICMQIKYEELLKDIRMKQHAFKNHLTAILSTHYTYHTYEQLVRAQDEYANILMKETRYTNLLLIGNTILAGFLYDKCKEMEAEGICVEYQVGTKFEDVTMPVHHMVEAIGILVDNALEAAKKTSEKRVCIEAFENEKACCFQIRNRCDYVPYGKIEQWFQMDYSSKGKNRGIGLNHVKTLCTEWNCNILCENVTIDNQNQIQFTLEMTKHEIHI